MTRNKIDVDKINAIEVTKVALGIDYKVTAQDVRSYISAGRYYITDTGSQGYKVVTYDYNDYKVEATVVTPTDKEPETTLVRGGKL